MTSFSAFPQSHALNGMEAARVSLPNAAVVSKPPAPSLVQDDATTALRRLLRIEGEIRDCAGFDQLGLLLVNEVQKLSGARQVVLFDLRGVGLKITRVSGVQDIDPSAPTLQWLCAQIETQRPRAERGRAGAIEFGIGANAKDETGRAFPFAHGHWVPLSHRARQPDHALLLIGEALFKEAQTTIATRLAQTAAHAAYSLGTRAPRNPAKTSLLKRGMMASTALVVLAMALPVPMTALAPAEVVAREAFVVSAPIDGVIDDILVPPNTPVQVGTVLVRYVDTGPRSQYQIASREVDLAEAKFRQLQQAAFLDDKARRDVAQARSEWLLKLAERDYTAENLQKTEIRAQRDGVVVYADRKDLLGKPVSTGQRILEIADPADVELRAQMPVADVLELKPGAKVRLFLDGNPLRPVLARVHSVSHAARPTDGQVMAYRVQARFDAGEPLPRLGVRGTAQLFSHSMPLGYYLFRRPITWLRQKVGV